MFLRPRPRRPDTWRQRRVPRPPAAQRSPHRCRVRTSHEGYVLPSRHASTLSAAWTAATSGLAAIAPGPQAVPHQGSERPSIARRVGHFDDERRVGSLARSNSHDEDGTTDTSSARWAEQSRSEPPACFCHATTRTSRNPQVNQHTTAPGVRSRDPASTFTPMRSEHL